jgi:hypothetical protein
MKKAELELQSFQKLDTFQETKITETAQSKPIPINDRDRSFNNKVVSSAEQAAQNDQIPKKKPKGSKKILPVKFLLDDNDKPLNTSTQASELDKSKADISVSNLNEASNAEDQPQPEQKSVNKSDFFKRMKRSVTMILKQSLIKKNDDDSDPPTDDDSADDQEDEGSDLSVGEEDGNKSDIYPIEAMEPDFKDPEEEADLVETAIFLEVNRQKHIKTSRKKLDIWNQN